MCVLQFPLPGSTPLVRCNWPGQWEFSSPDHYDFQSEAPLASMISKARLPLPVQYSHFGFLFYCLISRIAAYDIPLTSRQIGIFNSNYDVHVLWFVCLFMRGIYDFSCLWYVCWPPSVAILYVVVWHSPCTITLSFDTNTIQCLTVFGSHLVYISYYIIMTPYLIFYTFQHQYTSWFGFST